MLIALASYPKSGNTWLRALLSAATNDVGKPVDLNKMTVGYPNPAGRRAFEEVTGLDADILTKPEILERRPAVHAAIAENARKRGVPTFIKTHEQNSHLPDGRRLYSEPEVDGAIYLIRHPLDVAVSFAAHAALDRSETARFMVDERAYLSAYRPNVAESGYRSDKTVPQSMGRWNDHVHSWAGDDTTIIVRFEDMLVDPGAVLNLVSERFGLGFSKSSINWAVQATAFERLQAAEARSGFKEKPLSSKQFFRTGEQGGGAALSRDQRDIIWDCVSRTASTFGYTRYPAKR